ncbi:alpha-L-fucosidase-like [Acanthaster planci]|uniref:alpha-L-fucosidase n=1 Tax=Acanthaster planci TaxID=133434 RepID=A0A8B7XI75_ACAPL|nr:alpha-L-fucosidase-like [Acanthaster planci]
MGLISALVLLVICVWPPVLGAVGKYEPNWASLDSRPLPPWYDEAKIGIFMHWGVFSVPSFGSEWFWWNWQGAHDAAYVNFMKQNYPPGFTYADFAPHFTTEFYDPKTFAEIVQASGAKYVVLTSKHHEGFTNWPSKYSWNWNSMDVGPKRDLVGELATAFRTYAKDVHFGLYHSLFEWFNPLYLQDKKGGFKAQEYVRDVALPELYEIIENYKPDVLWSDGDWEATADYWNSTEFLAWLYNSSPVNATVATNDRWGQGTSCKHGGYYTCHDRYNPGVLQKHKWENAMTIDRKSWGFRREAVLADYYDMEYLTKTLAETISCGGNLLMNIGPTHDGRIVPIFEERLRQMGTWLKVNGEAVYSTKPWVAQNDTMTPGVWYTTKEGPVYAIVLDWPANNELDLGVPMGKVGQTKVSMLGYNMPLQWRPLPSGKGLNITMPALNEAQLPCQWAWVIKMDNLVMC